MCAGMPCSAIALAQPSARRDPERGEVRVGVGREHLGERGEPGRRHQRVAVERALLGGAVLDDLHHRRVAAERADGGAAADGLGEAREVRLHPEPLDRTTGGDGRARLHLVEDQHHAVPRAEVAGRLEVAGLRDHHADVHHHRLHDQAGDLGAAVAQHPVERLDVVERHHERVVGEHRRDALRHRRRRRLVASAHGVGVGHHREHHGVVMSVVRTLDLQDPVAPGRGARDADRVHGGLGAGIGETHGVEVEAPAELLGEGHRGGRRGGEVRAGACRPLDRLDHLRVRVPHHVDAEPAVEVEVLRAVDVPDVRALPTLKVDRVRVVGVEGGRDAVRQVLRRPFVERLRRGRTGHERGGLLGGDPGRVPGEGVVGVSVVGGSVLGVMVGHVGQLLLDAPVTTSPSRA